MKLRLLGIFIFLLTAAAVGFWGLGPVSYVKDTLNVDDFDNENTLQIGGNKVKVEIADTPYLQSLGLGGREGLTENEGMLFVFDTPSRYAFWMKGMRFSIDIVWISEDGLVADITKDLKPESYPAQYRPEVPALYVLEVNSGWTDRRGVKIGDEVILPE